MSGVVVEIGTDLKIFSQIKLPILETFVGGCKFPDTVQPKRPIICP